MTLGVPWTNQSWKLGNYFSHHAYIFSHRDDFISGKRKLDAGKYLPTKRGGGVLGGDGSVTKDYPRDMAVLALLSDGLVVAFR